MHVSWTGEPFGPHHLPRGTHVSSLHSCTPALDHQLWPLGAAIGEGQFFRGTGPTRTLPREACGWPWGRPVPSELLHANIPQEPTELDGALSPGGSLPAQVGFCHKERERGGLFCELQPELLQGCLCWNPWLLGREALGGLPSTSSSTLATLCTGGRDGRDGARTRIRHRPGWVSSHRGLD